MKSKMMKTMAVLLALFLVVYAGYQAWTVFYNPYSTEIAVNYSVNEAIHVNGIAVRTETIIEDHYDGSVSYIYEDAAKVNRNKPIAYAHASSDTVNKMIRAAELEKQIGLLEEASAGVSQLYGSSEFINDQIGNSVLEYSAALNSENFGSFSEVKDELLLAINKKTVITGEPNKFDERIAILKAEYDELNNDINADEAKTVLAPKSGYFISSVDGFESIINKESLFEKSVSEIEEIINQDIVTAEQKIGKVADNYKWYYVVSVSEEDANKFNVGRNVNVNFDGINGSVSFEIYEKIKDESSENTVIVLLCKTFTEELASLRQISADIVFSTVTGLRISEESIRFNENQERGVFILDRSEVKFKEIDIIYTGSNYVLVKWNQGAKNYLQLFDEVFIGGNDLYAGKVID